MYHLDPIIIDSDKQFRIPITGYLRSIGIAQIVDTKEYLDLDSVGGEGSVRIWYPFEINELNVQIKKQHLLETELSPVEIDNIRYYVCEYIDMIERCLRE